MNLKIGSNGLVSFGIKHCSRSFRTIEEAIPVNLDWILEIGVVIFENLFRTGITLSSATLIFLPNGTIGFGHEEC